MADEKRPEKVNNRRLGIPMMNENPLELITQMIAMTVNGQVMSRSRMARMMGNRDSEEFRNVYDNCFYPKPSEIDSATLRDMFDSNPFANRAVGLLPEESWAIPPEIYEDEDEDVTTQFEQALQDLANGLRGEANWYESTENQGNPLFEMLQRGDMLSGIGNFGVLLFGFDDIREGSGKDLSFPVEFVVKKRTTTPDPVGEPEDELDDLPQGTDGESEDDPEAVFSEDEFDDMDEEEPEPTNPGEDPELEDPEVEDPEDPEADTTEEDADVSQVPPKGQTTGKGSAIKPDFAGNDPVATPKAPPKWVPKVKLLFMRAFDQSLVQIASFDSNPASPRYGMPEFYNITFADWKNNAETVGEPSTTKRVHWSRVIHLADNLVSSEVIGNSRIKPIFPRLIDLDRYYGCSSEGYWQGALPGLAFTTHPQLGGEVEIDEDAIRKEVQNFNDSMQKSLIGRGLDIKTLAPQVTDPTPQIKAAILAICVYFGCPERIFMGSERGQLASGQDDGTWNDRLSNRQVKYITPRILIPVINRLIQVGTLPEPRQYKIVWQDLNTLSEDMKAGIAQKRSAALAQFVSGNIEAIMTPLDFLTKVLGMDGDEAKSVVENVQEAVVDRLTPDPQAQMDMENEARMMEAENPAPIVAGADGPPGKDGGFPPKKGPPVPPPGNKPKSGAIPPEFVPN